MSNKNISCLVHILNFTHYCFLPPEKGTDVSSACNLNCFTEYCLFKSGPGSQTSEDFICRTLYSSTIKFLKGCLSESSIIILLNI